MPSHYLLTTCLLSVYDHVVPVVCCTPCIVLVVHCTSYVVRRMLYRCTVVWLHHCTVALTWHSPSHGVVPDANRWEFVGGGIAIHKDVKLQRLGCVGLRRVRLVRWLAKRGWRP